MAYSNYSRRKPKAEYNFIEGHKVGLCREWYKNGSLKEKGTRCEVNEVTVVWFTKNGIKTEYLLLKRTTRQVEK